MSRVRMTAEEFAQLGLFPQPAKVVRKPGVKRTPRPKTEWPENILEAQIRSFLEARSWLVTRNHVGTYIPFRILMALQENKMTIEQAKRGMVRIGKKGDPDYSAERPIVPPGVKVDATNRAWPAERFFFEPKGANKPSPEQLAAIQLKRLAGIAADWFDSFEDDGWGHSFLPWYKARFGDRAGDPPNGATTTERHDQIFAAERLVLDAATSWVDNDLRPGRSGEAMLRAAVKELWKATNG
jgi:hypothetical protein